VAALLAGLAAAPARALGPRAAGVLLSTDRDPRVYTREVRLREAYLAWPLGRSSAPDAGWHMTAELHASGGTLTANRKGTWFATVGPVVALRTPGNRVQLHAGLRPTYLNDYRLGVLDVGSHLQFTSHAGIAVRLGRGLWLGYRIEHVSNADVDPANPGLNFDTFEARFEW